jgi:hypothetical protein
VSVADELSKLADLLDRGAITKKDYEDLKAELVRGERPRGRSRSRPWESDELLAVLRLAASHQEPLTAQRYSDLRTVGRVTGPTPAIFYKVFGSWSAACAAAGIRSGKKLHSNYSRKWTDEELLDFVIEYVSEPRSGVTGESLTVKGIDQWLRSLRASREAPSLSTLRNRLGSWSGMRSKALSAIKKNHLAEVVAGADLSGYMLDGANFSGRDISGANLGGANLAKADLYRADLAKADLSGANLGGADLTRANLKGADLTGVNLGGADLTLANLTRADLYGANLTEAKLAWADLKWAGANEGTIWPEGFDPVAAGVIFKASD